MRGAFTGAERDKKVALPRGGGGTILRFDEIGEMPLKICRRASSARSRRTVRPLGGAEGRGGQRAVRRRRDEPRPRGMMVWRSDVPARISTTGSVVIELKVPDKPSGPTTSPRSSTTSSRSSAARAPARAKDRRARGAVALVAGPLAGERVRQLENVLLNRVAHVGGERDRRGRILAISDAQRAPRRRRRSAKPSRGRSSACREAAQWRRRRPRRRPRAADRVAVPERGWRQDPSGAHELQLEPARRPRSKDRLRRRAGRFTRRLKEAGIPRCRGVTSSRTCRESRRRGEGRSRANLRARGIIMPVDEEGRGPSVRREGAGAYRGPRRRHGDRCGGSPAHERRDLLRRLPREPRAELRDAKRRALAAQLADGAKGRELRVAVDRLVAAVRRSRNDPRADVVPDGPRGAPAGRDEGVDRVRGHGRVISSPRRGQ